MGDTISAHRAILTVPLFGDQAGVQLGHERVLNIGGSVDLLSFQEFIERLVEWKMREGGQS